MPKGGKLSNRDIDFIKRNAHKISVEEIASKLDRSPDVVQKYINLHAKPAPDAASKDADKILALQELRASAKWIQLEKEYDDEELDFFSEEYSELMAQFKGNIEHTEKAQVYDCICLELQKHRSNSEKLKARKDVDMFEKMLDDFVDQHGDPKRMQDDVRSNYMALQNQILNARRLVESKASEWAKYQEHTTKIRTALNASREQRVKDIEESKENFLGVIKLLQNRDQQALKGREIELLKLAGSREYKELSKPHKYEDGNEDSPILSENSFGDDDE